MAWLEKAWVISYALSSTVGRGKGGARALRAGERRAGQGTPLPLRPPPQHSPPGTESQINLDLSKIAKTKEEAGGALQKHMRKRCERDKRLDEIMGFAWVRERWRSRPACCLSRTQHRSSIAPAVWQMSLIRQKLLAQKTINAASGGIQPRWADSESLISHHRFNVDGKLVKIASELETLKS